MTKARCLWVLMGFLPSVKVVQRHDSTGHVSVTTPVWCRFVPQEQMTHERHDCLISLTCSDFYIIRSLLFWKSSVRSILFLCLTPCLAGSSLCSLTFNIRMQMKVWPPSHLHGHLNQHEQLFDADPQILALHSFSYAGSLNVLKTPQQLRGENKESRALSMR